MSEEKNVWEEFDAEINTEELAAAVDEAKDKPSYKEVPHGTYDVAIEKMEFKKSQKGNPMVSIWFKILSGEYKDSRIFYNQVIREAFQIHLLNDFLRSFESSVDVKFESYRQYNDMLMDIMEEIEGKIEFELEYQKGNKGFSTFEINEVYDAA